ncbi:LPXTG-motif cell wall-anchored protein [Natronobacillus azotifigens]|uniref:Family 43 glycosylhydrolase n=1 Tax=Natronobacillus azotifigens TaxID=472978 RepID=A0A9J6RF98_9BACI|nr:LamG-like jellyroll fold domain-containing protein [Natronobacillus azotifigens]MCZ0703849.1 family 43 glycosylhydrolase [Natronobacillus azotifigens]
MKRFLAIFLVFLLLFPTSTLSVLASELATTESTPSLEPTAYYPLDGDLLDSTSSNDAGIPWRREEAGVSDWGPVDGYTFEFHEEGRNQAVYFDGTTGIKLADNLITSDTYSYSLWLKQTADIDEYTSALYTGIIGRRSGISPAIGGRGEIIYQVETGPAQETGLPEGYHYAQLPESYTPYEWSNIFVTVDKGKLTFYLNGEKTGEIDNVPNIYEGLHSDFLLGFNPFPDRYYVGYMDEVMFFDGEALTVDQIESYYHAVVEGFHPVEEDDEGDEDQSGERITNDQVPNLPSRPDIPEFTNVSVHDPSILTANGKFYAFGTHGEAAKSDDLMNWELFTNGYTTPGNVLFGDLSENLADAFQWAGEDDADSRGGFAVWAPEVFFNPDYKWDDGTTGAYMNYYSASSTYIRSVIGYAVAKEVEGPYEHVDTLIYSGFTNHEAYDNNSDVNKHWENTNIKQLIEDGVIDSVRSGWFNNSGGYNNTYFTNAIDANLFYDEDGTLWMTYGSWSGGIFILEVDKETGQVLYPGEDGETEDGRMIDRYFGTKISGGYTGSGEGPYVEYNAEDGYYYLYVTYGWLEADGAYHMRQFRSENPDGPYVGIAGEPAVLPNREAGNASFGNKLTGNFLFKREPGDPGTGDGYGYVSPGHNSIYTDKKTNQQFNVFHARFPNRGEQHEVRVHQMFMNQEGWRIMAPLRYAGETLDAAINTDDIIGSYKYLNHGKNNSTEIVESELIDLHADGTISGAVTGTWERDGYYATLTIGNQTYDGVFVEMWDEVSSMWLMTFTALSDQGFSAWGIQHPMKAATDEAIVELVADQIELPSTTFSDLNLLANGSKGTVINWSSSNPDVISTTGKVTRPATGEPEATVTLTAEFVLNDASKTSSFEVTVIPYQTPALQAHYRFDGDLSDETGQFDDGIIVGNRSDKIGEGQVSFREGRFGEALYLDGSSGVVLPNDLLKDDHFSIGFWFNPEELNNFTPSLFVMQDDDNWFTVNPRGWNNEILLWSRVIEPRETWFDGITGQTAQVGEWQHVVLTNEYGRVRIYVDGERVASANNFNQVVNGEALTIALGVNPFDTAFKGLFDDLVIYQAHTLSSEDVQTLYGGQIPEVGEVDPTTAHFTFDTDLSDITGNHPEATVTGNRLDNTGGAIDFSQTGVNQSIYFDGESGVNLGTGLITGYEYSVSFWLKPEELLDFTTTFFGAQSGSNWTSFLPGGSHGGGVTKLWSGENWYDANLDFMIELNEWTHISYTVDNGDLNIYVNGELAFHGEDFPNVFTNDQAVFGLGVNYWDVPYKGYIDELIIYDDHVLSVNDVRAYYNKTLPLIDLQDSDDETTDPRVKDEIVVDNIEESFVTETADERQVFIAKDAAKVFKFTNEVAKSFNDKDVIELTDSNVRVTIPGSVLRRSKHDVRIEMENVTDSLVNKIDPAKVNRLSDFIQFSLKDGEEAIDFSVDGIELVFTIDLAHVIDRDNLRVVYFNSDGVEVTEHGTEIINISETGEVTVRVTHFSTYGIIELVEGEPSDPVNPVDPDDVTDPVDDGYDSDDDSDSDDSDSDSNDKVSGSDDIDSDEEELQGLPSTATNMFNLILIGLWLILAAGAILVFNRKKSA